MPGEGAQYVYNNKQPFLVLVVAQLGTTLPLIIYKYAYASYYYNAVINIYIYYYTSNIIIILALIFEFELVTEIVYSFLS